MDKKLFIKMRKLRALAECPTGNLHEKAAAAARLAELILQNNLEMHVLENDDDSPDIATETLVPKGKRPFQIWMQILIHFVSRAVGARALFVRGTPQVHILGSKPDLDSFSYLLQVFKQDIEQLVRVYREEIRRDIEDGFRPPGKPDLAAFRQGAATEIGRRVVEARTRTLERSAERALVWVNKQTEAIDDHISQTYKTSQKPVNARTNADAFWDGRQAGKTVAVEGKASLESAKEALHG